MNGNNHGRGNKARRTRIFNLAPSTRAIRAALFGSATLLALAGSGVAYAGTCASAAPDTMSCNGLFTDTIPGIEFVPTVDLTLILGDSAPTSVTPAFGVVGVDATWGGNVGVVSHADITTDGADGIHQYGSTSATLTNDGSITTNVTAAGANAVDISAYGNVSVVNGGDINAYGTGAYDVTTVSAYSINGSVYFDNQASGTIAASSEYGTAIGVATVTGDSGLTIASNEGTISASSVNGVAVGLFVQVGYLALVTNTGTISATSTYGQAIGINSVSDRYSSGITNAGTITVASGQDQAIGIQSYARVGSSSFPVNNTGSITVTSSGGAATGVHSESYQGRNLVSNSGSIQATSSYRAEGILASSELGYAVVNNVAGTITTIGNDTATAIGIAAYSAYGSYVDSSGTVIATTYAGPAVGVTATTDFNGTGGFFGDASITNSGSISAISTTTDYVYDGNATGAMVQTIKGGARVYNSGSITASVNGYGMHSNAVGVSVGSSVAGNAYVGNSGSISAGAGTGHATGIEATSHYGMTEIVNTGDISALTNGPRSPYSGQAQGIVASSGVAGFVSGITNVTNAGNITATAHWLAEGIQASAAFGVATVTNTATGTITVTGDRNAIGIGTGQDYAPSFYVRGNFYDQHTRDAVIDNAGNITVVATGNTDGCGNTTCLYALAHATGIQAILQFGNDITITNSGNISVSAVGPTTAYYNPLLFRETVYGIQALTYAGDVAVDNSGSIAISATGYGRHNMGIHASSTYGDVSVINSGSITGSRTDSPLSTRTGGIWAQAGNAYYHGGSGFGGGISIVNSGDINAGTAGGTGIFAQSFVLHGNTTVEIDNSGHINAPDGNGIYVDIITNSDTATVIDNSGSITGRIGIIARIGGSGATTITNSGDISVAGAFDVLGMEANFSSYSLTANSHQTLDNSGSISASSVTQGALPSIYTKAAAKGVNFMTTYGDVTVVNSGSIAANAQWDYVGVTGLVASIGIATANQTYSGRYLGTIGDTTITNGATGVITSTAEFASGTGAATASGIYANQHATSRTYNGNDGRGYVSAASGITITNAGSISATALIDAAAYGSATANGILVSNQLAGFATLTNDGSVLATATNSGAIVATDPTSGMATATGISVFAPTATVALDAGGYVGAIATGASGTATGLSVTGSDLTALGLVVTDTVTAGNAGTINAVFHGAGGKAYGANITSAGDLSFANSGQIFATADGDAIGIALNTATNTTLINSGTISSVSVTGDNLAVRTGASTDAIQNTGTINGALVTGDGDDTFDNAVGGLWNAVGSSDFGAGDDTLSNAGTINLDNASITLGGFAASGNVFTNTGTISVAGDNNTIDMGAGNPLAFTNTGILSFQDGVPDDRLTIVGDFAGQGSLDMDVSQLNNAGDLLYINGNVVDGSVTTINTHVLDLLPTAATGTVAVVNVSGDSSADSFVLGDVTFDSSRSFLTVQAIGLQSEIDASNATADVFSIDFAVNGLSETGALAAAFVPAVQRLMNSQVGTWRQRMGVIDKMSHGPSVWARAFSDNGTVNPSHQESNFGQDGDLAFDQRSSGEEVGVDYAFNEAFSVGLLVGKAQASQSLNGTGLGSSKLDGNTSGVYATWISPAGFYADASYRRMSFDAKLNSDAGQSRTEGNADAFNVEAGYAWTLGDGLKLEPQLQYTRTTIDEVDTLEGAMAGFTPEEGTSSRARVGLAVRKSFGKGDTEWTPYATLSAVREFDGDNAYSIDGAFFGSTSTEGTSALVEGGLNVRTGNLSFSGGVNWQDGGALESVVGGQLGVRYSW